MHNIRGIIVREHIPEKHVEKFPSWISACLMGLALAMMMLYLMLMTTEFFYRCELWMVISYPMIMIAAAIASLFMAPYATYEEFIVEVTPELRAWDWFVITQDYNVEKMDEPVVFTLRKKTISFSQKEVIPNV